MRPVAQVAIDLSEGCDPAVKKNAARILKELQLEEERFSATLGTGQKLLTNILQQVGLVACLLNHNCIATQGLYAVASGRDIKADLSSPCTQVMTVTPTLL